MKNTDVIAPVTLQKENTQGQRSQMKSIFYYFSQYF